MRHAIAEASQAAHLAIASFQLEAAVCEELHHERDHVDVGDHAQQLKVETTQPNRVIGRGQVHKDHADLLLCFESCLDVIGQERYLVCGGAAMTETGLLRRELRVDHGVKACEHQPLEEF